MARKRMVTRTVQTTEAFVLALDVESAEPQNINVLLAGTFKDKEAILKAAKKVAETETLKLVQVVGFNVNEDLYGMSEEKFLANADKLEPRK